VVVSAGGVAAVDAHVGVRVLASQFEEQVPWSLIVVEALNTGAAVINDAAWTAKANEQPSARTHSLTFIPSSRQHRIAFRIPPCAGHDWQVMPSFDHRFALASPMRDRFETTSDVKAPGGIVKGMNGSFHA